MAGKWPEVSRAAEDDRRELVLSGQEINERLQKNGLDDRIFSLRHLNFLEISKSSLNCLPNTISQLSDLNNLVLHSNKLTSVPDAVGHLDKLHLLDLSCNSIECLPSLKDLAVLHSLLLSNNSLATIPDLSTLSSLRLLDLSHNLLTSLPQCPDTVNEIRLGHNNIQSLEGVGQYLGTKILSVEENQLTDVSEEITKCNKLKELKLNGNPIKDRKLKRLCENPNPKHVVDFVASKSGGSKGGKGKGKKKEEPKSEPDGRPALAIEKHQDSTVISVSPSVAVIRPYIVCCIVRDVDLSEPGQLKKFITVQTKLHEGICDKRQAATIATHDLKNVKGPLVYRAEEVEKIQIHPLFRPKVVDAKTLIQQLYHEAEEQRREKKRNQLSGVHKYLSMVRDASQLACLVDSQQQVISLPPITNSSSTKVTVDTKDLLLEVTSATSLDTCKKVMEELIVEIVKSQAQKMELTLEQVKVTDSEGQLKVMYPSRTDLNSSEYIVKRD